MKLYLIRHGVTKGNREHRYVGRTDEGLLEKAREELQDKVKLWQKEQKQQDGGFLQADSLYVSPLKRCRETAAVLYPGKEQIVIENLRECDFGEFEYRNYQELNGNPDFQRFIDSNGESGFPKGETLKQFQDRCAEAFQQLVEEELLKEAAGSRKDRLKAGSKDGQVQKEPKRERTCVLVVHGGTIMALLDRYSRPHKDYYDWQVKNTEGFGASVRREEQGFYLGDIERIW